MVIPFLVADLKHHGDWYYHGWEEVLCSRFLFASALALLGVEAVLARSRGLGKNRCQLLVLWGLLKPLQQFRAYVAESFTDCCKRIHEEWGLEEPPDGYEETYCFDSWVKSGRIEVAATQHAHGTNSEVVLWFVARRRWKDRGIKGEQCYNAFLFEALTRAKMRIHVLLEDLRHEEILPSGKKYWGKGLRLGLRKHQFIGDKKMSSAKHTLNILRLLNYCQRFLMDAEEATAALQDRKDSDGTPVANLTHGQGWIHTWIEQVSSIAMHVTKAHNKEILLLPLIIDQKANRCTFRSIMKTRSIVSLTGGHA